jgi:RNA polymerase sigma-70 factor (ECF subfamily)
MDEAEARRERVLKEALACRIQLLAYARSLLGDYAAAEDAVQDAMLIVVRKFDQFQEGTSMLAWCRAIVRLEVLKAIQKRQRERTLADRLLEDAVDAAFEEFQEAQRREREEPQRRALELCLEGVTERGRSILRSRFVDGLSYRQIGDRVGMKLEAVRKALFRVKKRVRDCLEARLGVAQ